MDKWRGTDGTSSVDYDSNPGKSEHHELQDHLQFHTSYQQQQEEEQPYQYPLQDRQRVSTPRRDYLSAADRARRNLNAKLANPLAGLSHETLIKRGGQYARKYQIGDEEDIRAFELGAVLAQAPEQFDNIDGLTLHETDILRREFTNRWSQPRLMYLVIVLCSVCAAVQGMGKSSYRTSPFPIYLCDIG
jgi:hypothetical protein